MPSRREFLETFWVPPAAMGVGALLTSTLTASPTARGGVPPWDKPGDPDDESFWFEISRAFTVDRSLINLNNGGVSPSPGMVQDAMKRHLDFSNNAPAYTMWHVLEPQREQVRERLALEFGCDKEEVAVTRNASEGLQICQFGFDLKQGDRVLTTTQDYPRMLTTFRQREARENIHLDQISIPVPCEDEDEVVERFRKGIVDQTKLILMCHVINITGQVLPVKKVVAMAREKGIPVIVDGAHALAHLDFQLRDLECDYYASSLHKWLFAPHGTGLLYVRKDKIRELWPLMAAPDDMVDNIRKFEEIGTHPAANHLAIAEALSFHQGLGAARKLKRLIYLRDYWANRLKRHDRIHLNTSQKPGFAGVVANVAVKGIRPRRLTEWLWETHRILVAGISHDEVQGIRVTPSVYTTLEELDRFCAAIEWVLENGLPSEES